MFAIALYLLALGSNLGIFILGKEMSKMKDAILALTAAVNDNTAATQAAIKAGIGTIPAGTVEAINAQTDQVRTNTAALQNAMPAES